MANTLAEVHVFNRKKKRRSECLSEECRRTPPNHPNRPSGFYERTRGIGAAAVKKYDVAQKKLWSIFFSRTKETNTSERCPPPKKDFIAASADVKPNKLFWVVTPVHKSVMTVDTAPNLVARLWPRLQARVRTRNTYTNVDLAEILGLQRSPPLLQMMTSLLQ
jgi:hypothetical protein